MNNLANIKEIDDALNILDQLLPLVDDASNKFRSARNWGFLDILGGGFLVDVVKHVKLNNASDIMNQINYLLQRLQKELSEIIIPTDFRMHMGTFSTFADFVFDGILADVYMQSKIMNSIEQISELKNRLNILKNDLLQLRSRQ